MTPLPRQSIFSQQQLAAVAASLSKLPRQSQAGLPYQQQWRAAEAAKALEAKQHRHRTSLEQQEAEQQHQRERQERRHSGSRRESRHASRERELDAAPAAAAGLRGSLDQGPQLSGFTVYTNGLQSPEFAEADDGKVTRSERPLPPAQQQQRPQRRSSEAAAPAEPAVDERDSAGSGVQWRSISSAALSSRSQGQEHEQQQQVQGGHPTKLRQHARHLSQLMLPALDASQVGGGWLPYYLSAAQRP
jgi:hypothetical protein